MALSILMLLCNNQHYPFCSELFIFSSWNSVPIKFLPSPPPLTPWQPPFYSLLIELLGAFHKWNHKYLPFYKWLISWNTTSSRSNCTVACVRISFFFQGWIILHYVYIYYILFLYSLIDSWVTTTFWLLWIMIYEHGCTNMFWVPASNVLGYISISRPERLYRNSIFNFLSKHYIVFHRGWTILHSPNTARKFQFLHILTNTFLY